ncbi:MAG: type II secretion system F family protein [Chlorobiaceae bacterium]|nr:type II secretion system F family protein [Chlorobiaceae bacterium]
MDKILLPFFAFVAVMLVMLLVYGVWVHFFDRRSQAKRQRLQAIHNVVHLGGQSLDSVQSTRQESAFETWIRSHSTILGQFENLVRLAHSQLPAWRLMGLMLALFTVVLAFGLLRHANPLLMLVLAVAIASTPVLWLTRQANKRRQAFGDKLPEALDYISRALRAGHSLTSAIGMLGKEFPDPVGHEFKTVFDEVGFGIPFKDALNQLADRVQSNDLNFFVISLMIQHETGGNLTELLDGLAKTMRERVKLRGKIRTLSSEGRASAWILGSMPFVLSGILMLINPGYISVLWTTPQGQNLVLIGGGLMVVGFFLLHSIVQIKV